jgi:hypothetical protein
MELAGSCKRQIRGTTTRSSARAGCGIQLAARSIGGVQMKRSKVVFEEGSVEATARLRQQDEQFCQVMRQAIEWGRESAPTGISKVPGTQRPIVNYTRPDS